MKAFMHATLAEDQVADHQVTALYGLRESISHALGLYDDKFRFFEQNGLCHEDLEELDRYLEYHMGTIDLNDLDKLIPFVAKMGRAYNELMADSLMTNPNNGGTTAIQYAGIFHTVLNYFYAEKAKLYPSPSNEPKLENE